MHDHCTHSLVMQTSIHPSAPPYCLVLLLLYMTRIRSSLFFPSCKCTPVNLPPYLIASPHAEMDHHHPFGDDNDDRTLQLGETYQYYISDHPPICPPPPPPPPPLLLPVATTGFHWSAAAMGVEGGADPATMGSNNSSSQQGGAHSLMRASGKDPAARRSRGPNNCKRTSGGGVKLSTDPQSVAARQRRHRISDRFKILKSLVPGGSKMDTVSMLEEAINYVKFLKAQIWLHQAALMLHPEDHLYRQTPPLPPPPPAISFPPTTNNSMPAAASASTNISVAGSYDHYSGSLSSTCCLALPSDNQHSMYAMDQASGDDQQQSIAFPCCTFHEEEMFGRGSLNY